MFKMQMWYVSFLYPLAATSGDRSHTALAQPVPNVQVTNLGATEDFVVSYHGYWVFSLLSITHIFHKKKDI